MVGLVGMEGKIAVEGNLPAGLGMLGAELGIVECWFAC